MKRFLGLALLALPLVACGESGSMGVKGEGSSGGSLSEQQVTVTSATQQEGAAGAAVITGSTNFRAVISTSPTIIPLKLGSENFNLNSQTVQNFKSQTANAAANASEPAPVGGEIKSR